MEPKNPLKQARIADFLRPSSSHNSKIITLTKLPHKKKIRPAKRSIKPTNNPPLNNNLITNYTITINHTRLSPKTGAPSPENTLPPSEIPADPGPEVGSAVD